MFGDNKEMIAGMKAQLSNQRWVDFEKGYPEYNPSFPEEPYEYDKRPQADPLTDEWNRFYAVPRGHHPNARARSFSWSVTGHTAGPFPKRRMAMPPSRRNCMWWRMLSISICMTA